MSNKDQTINVITLGCSKNTYDSEVLSGQLKASGKKVVHEGEGDTVVINTCGFIDNAKEESIDTILHYIEAKKQGLVKKVFVTGCLSERYADDLKNEIDGVDGYFGTNDLPKLLQNLEADYKHELIGERLLSTPTHYAYFKISEGCDRPCSFCAIPLMRGKHKSRTIESLVAEARLLARQGVKELIIIAQDSTYYGLDIYKERALAKLLKTLAEVDGIEWIRLHYAFPSGFPMDVLEVIANEPKICNYLDMPLQHISTDLLQSMKRGTTKEKTIELVNTIREKVPGLALRTTLIVGYPGETEAHFEELMEWVAETKFDRLGAFTYSHEENTSAHLLEDDVPQEVKEARLEEIMNLQADISFEKNQEKVGNTYKVIIDRKEEDSYVGRTEHDSIEVDNEVIIYLKEDLYLSLGQFVEVEITEASEFDLIGEII